MTLIKTFSNGSTLTARWHDGKCRLEIDGAYGLFNPLMAPVDHPVAGKIVANVQSGGRNYALVAADMDALAAFEATRPLAMTDRMARLADLAMAVSDAKAVIGSAWAASIEHAREHGARPDSSAAEAAERDAVIAAEADLATAKAADPEAWAAYEAARARRIQSNIWH